MRWKWKDARSECRETEAEEEGPESNGREIGLVVGGQDLGRKSKIRI